MDNLFDPVELKKVYDRGIIHVGNLVRFNSAINRASSGKAVNIGFIGGSITAGCLSSTHLKSYASLTCSWWKDKFPKSRIGYINAGIGATTSQFGVARVEEDLLSKNPDVVFVEFSVNDKENDSFKETFESLIRRILLSPTQPAVFIINSVCYDTAANAQRVHNQIGLYYDLPIVSMRESIYAELERGRLTIGQISSDSLHPNDLGHSLMAGVITNLLDYIYDACQQKKIPSSFYTVPVKTLTDNRYFQAVRSNNKNSDPVLKGFAKDESVQEGNWDIFRFGWSGRKEGNSIHFEITGSLISIQYRKYAVHPAPVAKAVIDGDLNNPAVLDANFDETWGDCLYLQDVYEGKPGKHTVEITVTKEAENKEFYLVSIISA